MKTLKTKKFVWSALAVCLCVVIGVLSLSFLSACDKDNGVYYTDDGVAYTYDIVCFDSEDSLPKYMSFDGNPLTDRFCYVRYGGDPTYERTFTFLDDYNFATSCLLFDGSVNSAVYFTLKSDSYIYFYVAGQEDWLFDEKIEGSSVSFNSSWLDFYYGSPTRLDMWYTYCDFRLDCGREEGFYSMFFEAGDYTLSLRSTPFYLYLYLMVIVTPL